MEQFSVQSDMYSDEKKAMYSQHETQQAMLMVGMCVYVRVRDILVVCIQPLCIQQVH